MASLSRWEMSTQSNDIPIRSMSQRLTWLQRLIFVFTCVSILFFGLWPMIPAVTEYPFTASHDTPAQHDQQSPNDVQAEAQPVSDISNEANDGLLKDPYQLSTHWDVNAAPTRREFHWRIHDAEYNPDGVFRQMMMINDQFPGPMIEVNEGDIIAVTIDNQAVNATSIHWHGMYQRGTPWMDGTVGISGCPIAPGKQFTYEFNVTGQSGSYFYHAHQGVQAADGLFGPLVIHSRSERDDQKLEYATDRVVMVSDHYHDPSNALLIKYLEPDAENAEPVPDAVLINGKAIRDCSTVPHRNCNNQTMNVQQPRIELEAGKLHRLRLIHTGVFAEMQVSVDQTEFAITEVDGVDVNPVYFDRLNIQPAQRYSIIVSANDSDSSLTWMRIKMLSTCFAEPNEYTEAETKAVINFNRAGSVIDPDALPTSVDWAVAVDLECRDMNTAQLVPVQILPAPPKVDHSFYLRSNFEIGAYRLSRGVFNTTSWRADVSRPSLHRLIDGLQIKNESFNLAQSAAVNDKAFDLSKELVIQTNRSQVIDLQVSNFDDGSHAMHLHGHKFWVLAQGHGYPAANLTETVNLDNPLRRDTATVEAFGWMLIRFVADNPGAWAFHCHVAWHAEAGLMMQFITMADKLVDMEVPSRNVELCSAPPEELERGMSPKDDYFYFD